MKSQKQQIFRNNDNADFHLMYFYTAHFMASLKPSGMQRKSQNSTENQNPKNKNTQNAGICFRIRLTNHY